MIYAKVKPMMIFQFRKTHPLPVPGHSIGGTTPQPLPEQYVKLGDYAALDSSGREIIPALTEDCVIVGRVYAQEVA